MNLKHILNTQQFLNKDLTGDIFRAADSLEKSDKKGKVILDY